jgi:predicted MFS family arabinose efflux permease
MLTGFAVQIQTVSVGWYVYDLTRNPFDLGLVGLSQFLPALMLVVVTGSVADRFSRRGIMATCLVAMAGSAVTLLFVTTHGYTEVWPVFASVALYGLARAFYNPARQSLVPNLVPPALLPTAIAANSTGNQMATICGPAVGGLLYAIRPELAYGAAALFALMAAALVTFAIPRQGRRAGKLPPGWGTLAAGFRYIWSNKLVLGAISLDLFAVLFGGAIALLPIYARDILEVGPAGLGLLRSGPAIGAIAVSTVLMVRPIRDHAGPIMFLAVAGFSVATIVFSLSTMLWLSVAMLVLIGAFDMVGVNLRSILIQLGTPDELRGRVSAVNQVFIGASNEVGAFRAGSMAVLIGPVAAVAVGGVATLAVTALWARIFPALRQVRQMR